MTVGIDVRVLTRGTRTGVEEYTINLLSRLLRLNQNINFKLFFNAFNKTKFNYDWVALRNVSLHEFRIPNRFLFTWARYLNTPKIDKLLGGVDVFFNPHFFNAPLSKRSKKVMTFHDLSFELHPEFFSWRKQIWQKFMMNTKKEAASASRIIAVSESTKQDLIDLYEIDPVKIKVIYSGVGEEFIKMSNFECKMSGVAQKYHLPRRYILYFGTIEPRKNIVGLIRAFELLKEKNKDFKNVCLVVAGGKGWLFKEIFKTAANSRHAKQIIFTGFVSPEDKVYLYNLADLFVYPSFFEGFGFPPLEAMACGVPTITSNTSSLPEIAGEAAMMVDPYDIEELAWGMEQILSDEKLSKEMKKKKLGQGKDIFLGQVRAGNFKIFNRINMRIGIDGRFLGPKGKGLGRYTQKLIEELEKIDSRNQFVIFLRQENWDEFEYHSPRFKKVLADWRWYSLAEQLAMPAKIHEERIDLMHFPHFNVPIFYFGPFVVTIHDLILRHFKTRRASTLGPIKYWLKNIAYRIVIWSAIKRAKKIIVPSNYVKKDILNNFNVDEENIVVTYEGAPEISSKFNVQSSKSVSQSIQNR